MEVEEHIKLKKDDEGKHHYIPLNWVTSVEDGKVKIDRPSNIAMREWVESSLFVILNDETASF